MNSTEPEFQEVRAALKGFIECSRDCLLAGAELEVISDTETLCRIIMTFPHGVAEIACFEPDFAPFRYISYEMHYFDGGVQFWYDKHGESIGDALSGLEKAISESAVRHFVR